MAKYFFYILLFISFFGSAQDLQELPPVPVNPDSLSAPSDKGLTYTDSLVMDSLKTKNILYSHTFSPDFQDKYVGEDYNYSKTSPRLSLWDRFVMKMSYYLSRIFSKKVRSLNEIIKYVLYALCTLIVLSGLYYLLKVLYGKEGNWFFGKKNEKINPMYREIEENIHEIDFKKVIFEYEQNQEYRPAIRYQFLHTLKQLTDSGKIEWNPDKTNSDYLREIKNQTEKENFKRIVYIFDHIWYGEFPIDKEKYQRLVPEFQKLNITSYE